MNHHSRTTRSTTTRPRGTRPAVTHRRHLAAAVLGLTTVAALLAGNTSAATASTTSATCAPSKPTFAWKPAVTSANAALAATLKNLQHHNYGAAATHLHALKHQTRIAHTAATALIGRPPTDPESDDPPGVAAVQGVAGLEHRISMQLVPPFKSLTRADAVRHLGTKLNLAVACRDVMLTKVIALNAGKRDDYADGLADTLPGYDQELNAMSAALAGTGLTNPARTYIGDAQRVVTATRTDMQRVFGGGERSPGLPR